MQEINLKSEVAGTVYEILCAVGDVVEEGQELLVIESMKMEVPVIAPGAGKVARLFVGKGDVVVNDQLMVAIEAAQK